MEKFVWFIRTSELSKISKENYDPKCDGKLYKFEEFLLPHRYLIALEKSGVF